MDLNINLPPINQFETIMAEYNLKKCFQYLFYFTKSEQRVYSMASGNRSPKVLTSQEWQLIPSSQDRNYIIKYLNDVLSLNNLSQKSRKQKELLIISAQRLIIGMIMSGHVHIYQILIRQLMPLFIKIICNQVSYDSSLQDLFKKIRQFCKQTILILSVWFPKSFYDPKKPSWFQKAVSKYKIVCQFVLYYTNNKIEEYQNLIVKLRIGDSKQQCLECVNCLVSSGKNYQFLKNIPELPEVIKEEDQVNSIMSNQGYSKMQSHLQKQYRKDLYLDSPSVEQFTTENSLYYGNTQKKPQQLDKSDDRSLSYMSKNSKLSEKIRKYRQNKADKSRSFLSSSRLSSKLGQSKLSNRSLSLRNKLRQKSKINIDNPQDSYSLQNTIQLHNKNSNTPNRLSKLRSKIAQKKAQNDSISSSGLQKSRMSILIKKHRDNKAKSHSKNHYYDLSENQNIDSNLLQNNSRSMDKSDLKSRISYLRTKRNNQSKISRLGNRQRLIKKTRDIKQKKQTPKLWHNAYDDNKVNIQEPMNQCQTAKKSSQSTQGTMPRSSQQSIQKKQSQFIYQSLFLTEDYKIMPNQLKNILRRQSLKIQHKTIENSLGQKIDLKSKTKKQKGLQLKFITDQNIKLINPRIQNVLLVQQNNHFQFNFADIMKPLVINTGIQQMVLPVCIISCLKPLKQPYKLNEGAITKSIEVLLDKSVFNNFDEIKQSLHLHQFQQNGKIIYQRSYGFFGQKIILKAQFMSKGMQMNLVEIMGHQYNDNIDKSKDRDIKVKINALFMNRRLQQKVKYMLDDMKNCIEKIKKAKKINKVTERIKTKAY